MIGRIPRPTPLGATLLGLGVALAAFGVGTSDNTLVVVAAALLGPVVADAAIGRHALARTRVRRVLPEDLFAGVAAPGALVVETGSAVVVRVEDPVADVVGAARGPGSVVVPVVWRFPRRGIVELGAVRISTEWPLGIWVRSREILRATTLYVAPRPRSGGLDLDPDDTAVDGTHRGADRVGDPKGLRPFTTGDRARDVHWPTSARADEPHVVDRSGSGDVVRVVAVRTDVDGDRLERALESAAGALLAALKHGPVTLVVDEERYGPGTGDAFRRGALERLARAGSAP